MVRVIYTVLSILLFSSCGTSKVSTDSFKYSYCISQHSYHKDNFIMDPMDYPFLQKSNLSDHDITLCQVLAISKDLDKLLSLSEQNSDDLSVRMEKMELRQNINQKISLAKTELDAFISELDCEGERADLAAGYLDDINGKRNTQLTVGSVIVGSLTIVAAALIKNDDVEVGVDIAGGLISAGLGAMTINPKGKKIEFYHSNNILKPLWIERNNDDYPNLVWNIFQIDKLNTESHSSLMESTKERWMKFVLKEEGEIDSKSVSLFFGEGGQYTAEELHLRSEMLDQVKSSVRYINQLFSILESDLYQQVY